MRVYLGFRWKHVWSERYRILSTLLGKKPKGRVSIRRFVPWALFFYKKRRGLHEHHQGKQFIQNF